MHRNGGAFPSTARGISEVQQNADTRWFAWCDDQFSNSRRAVCAVALPPRSNARHVLSRGNIHLYCCRFRMALSISCTQYRIDAQATRGVIAMDTTSITISVFAGVFGCAYFIYGKKQQKLIPLLSGVGLCVVPYFLDSNMVLIGACVAMLIAPFLIKIDF